MTEDGEKKKKDLVITKHTGLPFDCDLYDRSRVSFFNKCSKNSPTSSGGEMNCTSEHICSKKSL